jgi:hypothetical protein
VEPRCKPLAHVHDPGLGPQRTVTRVERAPERSPRAGRCRIPTVSQVRWYPSRHLPGPAALTSQSCCDRTTVQVSHLHSINKRLTAHRRSDARCRSTASGASDGERSARVAGPCVIWGPVSGFRGPFDTARRRTIRRVWRYEDEAARAFRSRQAGDRPPAADRCEGSARPRDSFGPCPATSGPALATCECRSRP